MNKQTIKRSLTELKNVLTHRFGKRVELYLFGSVVRDTYGPESDIDVLVLLPDEVDTRLKTEVIDLAFDVGLRNDVVFNMVSRSKKVWQSGRSAVTPFFQNLQKEAVRI